MVYGLPSEHRLAAVYQRRIPAGGENVTSEVAGDVISLRASCAAILPLTSETKVIGALSADMVVAKMVIEDFGVEVRLSAVGPKTDQGRLVGGRGDR